MKHIKKFESRLDNGDKELFHSFKQPKLWDRYRVKSISTVIKKKYI